MTSERTSPFRNFPRSRFPFTTRNPGCSAATPAYSIYNDTSTRAFTTTYAHQAPLPHISPTTLGQQDSSPRIGPLASTTVHSPTIAALSAFSGSERDRSIPAACPSSTFLPRPKPTKPLASRAARSSPRRRRRNTLSFQGRQQSHHPVSPVSSWPLRTRSGGPSSSSRTRSEPGPGAWPGSRPSG